LTLAFFAAANMFNNYTVTAAKQDESYMLLVSCLHSVHLGSTYMTPKMHMSYCTKNIPLYIMGQNIFPGVPDVDRIWDVTMLLCGHLYSAFLCYQSYILFSHPIFFPIVGPHYDDTIPMFFNHHLCLH